jgi:phosphatidate cytidylyltransferase
MGPLTKRILVAIPAVALLLFLTFLPQTLPLRLLMFIVTMLGLLEFLRLADQKKLKTLHVQGLIALGMALSPWVLKPVVAWDDRAAFLLGLLLLSMTYLWSKRVLSGLAVSVSVTFFGVAYFALFAGYFFRLLEMSQGCWQLLLLYCATWAYDTGGYFAGKKFGKHRLAPVVSPQKSWEGCTGGFALVLVTLFALWKIFPFYAQEYSAMDILALSILLSFFGQIGDLVESAIKRSFAAKDSGAFFPGHGGIFDRIDSLLFNAPVLFYYLVVMNK